MCAWQRACVLACMSGVGVRACVLGPGVWESFSGFLWLLGTTRSQQADLAARARDFLHPFHQFREETTLTADPLFFCLYKSKPGFSGTKSIRKDYR